MSRPFSYNDENFTVIGNLLFCHIRITKDIPAGNGIVEIPPKIFDRLEYKTNLMLRVTSRLGTAAAANAAIGIKDISGIHYLYSGSDIDSSAYGYLIGFYLLKDI